ncbi:glycoside hydrolase family protein [Pectobacterium parmentieri]|uniref:glycoside hydrolase family protein n=1 Tax=Pectobacterium parmentieri TaxID=1905730 RepID=UPI003B21C087
MHLNVRRCLKKLNRSDFTGACNELRRWNKAAGQVWQGLTNRREAERMLCLEKL